ncbi:MAG: hypothetical protein PVF05_10085, partial [Gemmatimonadales bacterium]
MRSHEELFAELKRRSVFKVAAVYGAVGFGVLQVVDPLADALRLPESFVPFVVALLLLGFPVALVLAWAFEVTPGGVHRMGAASREEIEHIVALPAAKRWPAGLIALAGVTALLFGAWQAGVRTGRSSSDSGAPPVAASASALTFVDIDDDPRPSIAVLPFADMSAEGNQEYFSDGMTEELLNALARIHDLRVAARTSSFAFKGQSADARTVGDSLGVAHLVEGSVRKAGDRLRITAQLIDTQTGSHLWSDQYDRELGDVFAIQTEIADAIARALRVPLGLAEHEQLVSPTEDLQVYDLYLNGRALLRERGKNVDEAIRLFEAAIARDSNWAPAWAGLAEARTILPYFVSETADSAVWAQNLEAGERAALRALELDPNNSSAAVALGNAYRDRWEWEPAESAYVRALSTDPDNADAHQQYAEFLSYTGRLDEAYEAARRALALDRSILRLDVAGYIARYNGLYPEATQFLDEGIRLDADSSVTFLWRLRALVDFETERTSAGRDLYLAWLRLVAPDVHAAALRAWPEDELVPPPAVARLVSDWSPSKGAELWMERDEPGRALDVLESYGRTRA